jgi:hypothetical protein
MVQAPLSDLSNISDRAYELFTTATGGDVRSTETATQHLAIRMMYIARATSIALRLNSSWVLTHPALSLLRDRFEQVARFSWLARQRDNTEMSKYLASYYARSIKLHHGMTLQQKAEFDRLITSVPGWLKEKPTKEQREYLDRWNSIDLFSMVKKRDALPPLADTTLGNAPLADLYNSVYAQFSSVTHYDMYSINMLSLHKPPKGDTLVLAPDPGFPAIIFLDNALFDLIQCFKACHKFFATKLDDEFEALHDEYKIHMESIIGPPQ